MEKKEKNLESRSRKKSSKTTSSSAAGVEFSGNEVRVSLNGNETDANNAYTGEVPVEVVDSGVTESVINRTGADGGDVARGVKLLVDVSTEILRMDKQKRGGLDDDEGVNVNGSDDGGEIEGKNIEITEDDDVVSSDGDYEFCVGDFVWGKVKSYPWWPGQIYDPSDASELALKVKQRNRFLVAYFDGTFAWCRQSQLRPFVQHFAELSKESNAKNFVNAMDKALREIGRLMELKMACGCLSDESKVGLDRPYVINSGIKQGVLVPVGGMDKLWSYLFDPVDCLNKLKAVSRGDSVGNLLELNELKSWLSSFFRSKGVYPLPLFHEPGVIPGLEDKEEQMELICDLRNTGPIEEECDPSPEQQDVGQTDQFILQKCNGAPGVSSQRRKRKSIAEILKEDEVKDEDFSAKKERKARKKKGDDEAANSGGGNTSSRPKRVRMRKLLETTEVTETPNEEEESDSEEETLQVRRSRVKAAKKKNKGSGTEDDGSASKEDNSDVSPVLSPSTGRKKKARSDDSGSGSQNVIDRGHMSRERKLSKYLCPPYTNIIMRPSKEDIAIESLRFSNKIQEAHEEAEQEEAGHDTDLVGSGSSSATGAAILQVSAKDAVSGVRALATDVYALEEQHNSYDEVLGFITECRNSLFEKDPEYERFIKSRRGRKRKNVDLAEQGSSPKDSERKHFEQTSDNNEAEANKNFKEKETSAAVHAVFLPGSAMPSKEDLIRIYGKFGALNKEETEIYHNDYFARIVFLKKSDAIVAYDSSQLVCPFGNTKVMFEIDYPESPPKPPKRIAKRSAAESSSSGKSLKESGGGDGKGTEDEPVSAIKAAASASPLQSVKEKLEHILTDLEKAGDGDLCVELKTKLKNDINGLLEVVGGLAGPGSSSG